MTFDELMRPLSKEELEKIVPWSDEEIEAALEQGRKEYALELASQPTFPGYFV